MTCKILLSLTHETDWNQELINHLENCPNNYFEEKNDYVYYLSVFKKIINKHPGNHPTFDEYLQIKKHKNVSFSIDWLVPIFISKSEIFKSVFNKIIWNWKRIKFPYDHRNRLNSIFQDNIDNLYEIYFTHREFWKINVDYGNYIIRFMLDGNFERLRMHSNNQYVILAYEKLKSHMDLSEINYIMYLTPKSKYLPKYYDNPICNCSITKLYDVLRKYKLNNFINIVIKPNINLQTLCLHAIEEGNIAYDNMFNNIIQKLNTYFQIYTMTPFCLSKNCTNTVINCKTTNIIKKNRLLYDTVKKRYIIPIEYSYCCNNNTLISIKNIIEYNRYNRFCRYCNKDRYCYGCIMSYNPISFYISSNIIMNNLRYTFVEFKIYLNDTLYIYNYSTFDTFCTLYVNINSNDIIKLNIYSDKHFNLNILDLTVNQRIYYTENLKKYESTFTVDKDALWTISLEDINNNNRIISNLNRNYLFMEDDMNAETFYNLSKYKFINSYRNHTDYISTNDNYDHFLVDFRI
ncbi:hypothetical protein [Alphaentomopoxvirus acuprea]|uniref:Uncharacterized protein n=1 Tax=Alphaentomopoxvirus acuprea TaxID=62099 RepID=W6JIX6_9POXV|nr:hypothetical protein BA82_gp157 [Anomala cuprea entomopoxvirus]BAO49517.1 hypothetical protein [Anomala cuprea entomopoxvirus]